MAYTKTAFEQLVEGNKRVVTFDLTADAASGAVDTGLGVITAFSVSPVSAATAGGKWKRNLNSGATALNGSLMASSVASGDVYQVICYGR